MQLTKGQLVHITYRDEDGEEVWEYGAVAEKYDNMVCIDRQNGGRIMVHPPDAPEFDDASLDILPITKGGEPVIVKKTLLGKYKYPKAGVAR